MARGKFHDSGGLNPFGELIGLTINEAAEGTSRCELTVKDQLLNPYGLVHGGVIYSLADTGMGAALYSLLDERERCVTAEIKIIYTRGVRSGTLVCRSVVAHKGKRLAFLESNVQHEGRLAAKALGTFSII